MGTIDLLNRARQIKSETNDGANTAERVGGLLVDMIQQIELLSSGKKILVESLQFKSIRMLPTFLLMR